MYLQGSPHVRNYFGKGVYVIQFEVMSHTADKERRIMAWGAGFGQGRVSVFATQLEMS